MWLRCFWGSRVEEARMLIQGLDGEAPAHLEGRLGALHSFWGDWKKEVTMWPRGRFLAL